MKKQNAKPPLASETSGWEKINEYHYPGDFENPSTISWQNGQLRIHYATFGADGQFLSSRRFMPASDADGALIDKRGGVRRFSTFTAAKEALFVAYGEPEVVPK